jgi:hypothetical protein
VNIRRTSNLNEKMRYVKSLFVTISLLYGNVVASTLPPSSPSASKGEWTTVAPIAGYERQEFTTVALNSTSFYVLGGILPELNRSGLPNGYAHASILDS